MKNLTDLTIFIKVIECGGFSSAARLLHLSPATVSKQIARLEAELNVRLFERNTRHLRITEEGCAIAQRVRAALSLLDDAVEIARQGAREMTGRVRVTAPVPFGERYVAPLLGRFQQRYPQLEIDLQLTDRIVDLYEDDIDLAIRIGALADSRLVSRQLARCQRILVASPAYLKRYGTPHSLTDLSSHQCLVLASCSGWSLASKMSPSPQHIHVAGALSSDNGTVLRQWSLMGLGITLREMWDVADELRRGELVHVLAEWAEAAKDIHAVRPYRDPVPHRIKQLVDDFQVEWQNTPWCVD